MTFQMFLALQMIFYLQGTILMVKIMMTQFKEYCKDAEKLT